ncbi:MAG: diguanylate cyclase [Bacillota bacterium]|nr:diguanylate cyclase [Bacillota bacterium]MDW7676981.1 diguanylate cyclase [Bacillota bacterium]
MNLKRYDPLRILLVEDEEGSRERIAVLLERRFSQVLVASNGEQGWELFQEHQPEVVLTGLNLPDISGLTLISRIREVNSTITVMIITAYNETEYLSKAIDLGVLTFLMKPLDIDKLDGAVNKVHCEYLIKKELEHQRSYIRTVLDFQESMVIVTDGQMVVDANQRFRQFFNLAEEKDLFYLENVFQHLNEMPDFHRFKESDWEKTMDEEQKIIITDADSGEERYFHMKAARFPDQPHLKIISLTDVTELEHERQYYQQLAIIDPLTQIYNRVQFNRSLAEEIQKSRRFHTVFSLVMFDIDCFKQVNDTYGHQLGDKILVELTDVVNEHIREIDIFARFGGEEFIILAPETDLRGAEILAEKLRQEIEAFSFSHSDPMTCSFGVSMYKNNDQADDLIKRVDDRLYRAKNRGRNQVCST